MSDARKLKRVEFRISSATIAAKIECDSYCREDKETTLWVGDELVGVVVMANINYMTFIYEVDCDE